MITALTFAGQSAPVFWLGLLLILVFLPSANRGAGPAAMAAAEVCAACGDIAVVKKGQALICETCGTRAGRLPEDQTG